MIPITEGLTNDIIGTYDYLKPVPYNNTWSEDTINKFIDKFNTVNALSASEMLNSSSFNSTNNPKYISNCLEKEALYYINNGKWPMNKYVQEYLSNPKNILSNIFNGQKNLKNEFLTVTNVNEVFPNRIIYATFISPYEMQLTPVPISYQIFKGNIAPPESI
jgi:hypothetical protein